MDKSFLRGSAHFYWLFTATIVFGMAVVLIPGFLFKSDGAIAGRKWSSAPFILVFMIIIINKKGSWASS